MNDTNVPTCPVCGQGDQVIKLSDYKEKQANPASELSIYLTGKTPDEQSGLARRLAPPPKPLPNLPDKPSSGYILVILLLISLNWGFGARAARGEASLILQVLLVLCFLTLLVVSVIFVYKYTQYRKKYWIAIQPDPEWQQAREKWNRQYYCMRDDHIFEIIP